MHGQKLFRNGTLDRLAPSKNSLSYLLSEGTHGIQESHEQGKPRSRIPYDRSSPKQRVFSHLFRRQKAKKPWFGLPSWLSIQTALSGWGYSGGSTNHSTLNQPERFDLDFARVADDEKQALEMVSTVIRGARVCMYADVCLLITCL
jgi:hypothetical protein